MPITKERMKFEMEELARKIKFPSNDLSWLRKAMESKLLENSLISMETIIENILMRDLVLLELLF